MIKAILYERTIAEQDYGAYSLPPAVIQLSLEPVLLAEDRWNKMHSCMQSVRKMYYFPHGLALHAFMDLAHWTDIPRGPKK